MSYANHFWRNINFINATIPITTIAIGQSFTKNNKISPKTAAPSVTELINLLPKFGVYGSTGADRHTSLFWLFLFDKYLLTQYCTIHRELIP